MTKPPATSAGLEDPDLGWDWIDTRATLLRVLTDLYLQRVTHTSEEEHYYTELALRLIDAADVSERAALAQRLAAYPSAPVAVVRRLARDVIEVAAPILQHSPCMTAADLEAIAEGRGSAHAQIIAARFPAARPAARPAGAGDAQVVASELSELFYAAPAPERRLILINLDYASLVPWRPVVALQPADMRRLESAALRHNAETLIRELGRTLGLSRAQGRRIVNDELGEPMVVVAKALTLPVDVVQRMLLFINPWAGQSVDRIYQLSDLHGEISVDSARRLIAIWRDAEETETSPIQHEPVGWRTAADNARRALSEVLHRPDRERERRARSGGH
ncbi:MAG TPA: hypothetical protein VH397_14715 [Xanthobacteraceae bacterium]|jgi:hypothetical protein